jgi:Fur family ferric uptake transcriptional regulator
MQKLAQRHILRDELVARGVRMTRQREVLVDLIQNSTRHLDAETLWKLAAERDPGINLATVYRTLSLLKHYGLVDELDLMHLEGEKHYYEVTRLRTHIHLACFQCGAIAEYQSELYEKLQQQVTSDCGFEIKTGRLEFGGVCASCRRQGPRPLARGHRPAFSHNHSHEE